MSNPLINKMITAVYLANDGTSIRFDIRGQEDPVFADAVGDCCSHTWIENVDGEEQLIGAVVAAVEDIPMPDLGSMSDDDDIIKYYGCKITTDKGYATIEYRNKSNGYYGGGLAWTDVGELDDNFRRNSLKV